MLTENGIALFLCKGAIYLDCIADIPCPKVVCLCHWIGGVLVAAASGHGLHIVIGDLAGVLAGLYYMGLGIVGVYGNLTLEHDLVPSVDIAVVTVCVSLAALWEEGEVACVPTRTIGEGGDGLCLH